MQFLFTYKIHKNQEMNCFDCFNKKRDRSKSQDSDEMSPPHIRYLTDGSSQGSSIRKAPLRFTFTEIAAATKNFSRSRFIGEGGFGSVYRCRIRRTGEEEVAVKYLDRCSRTQGVSEFKAELATLGRCNHPNLVRLIGYCADYFQRAIVYEYLPFGSLDNHLFDLKPGTAPLEWGMRMKIAEGVAKGLEYLHNRMDPQIIHRDLKPSNILLDRDFTPKLADFGLARMGPTGDQTHVTTLVVGTYGYYAPEYAKTGRLTAKSDVYGFGVVLLELITSRASIEKTGKGEERSIVEWVTKLAKDRMYCHVLVDPMLEGRYPLRGLQQALAVGSLCVQENADARPVIADVVAALSYLSTHCDIPRDQNDDRGVKLQEIEESSGI